MNTTKVVVESVNYVVIISILVYLQHALLWHVPILQQFCSPSTAPSSRVMPASFGKAPPPTDWPC